MTGRELYTIRKKMDKKQVEFASLLGLTAQTISHMEHDRKVITQAIEKAVIAQYKLWQITFILKTP